MGRVRISSVSPGLLILCILLCPALIFASSATAVRLADDQRPLSNSPQKTTSLSSSPCASLGDCLISNNTPHDFKIYYSTRYCYQRCDHEFEPIPDSVCSQLLINSRSLTISGSSVPANLTSVTSLISRLAPAQLQDLHWTLNTPLPPEALTLLSRNHPQARLHYDIPLYTRDRSNHSPPNQTLFRSILNNTNLYSLTADIQYSDGDGESMPLIHDILMTCPKLRELDLSLGYYGGCVAGLPHIYAFDFDTFTHKNASFPPLEVLKLPGYRFDSELSHNKWYGNDWSTYLRSRVRQPWKQLLSISHLIDWWRPCNSVLWALMCESESDVWTPTVCPTDLAGESNIDGWLQTMDFNNLHTLELTYPSALTLRKLQPALTSISSLSISSGNVCTSIGIERLLSNTPNPLSTLKLHNIRFSTFKPLLNAINTRHNHTLNSFSLHEHNELRDFTTCHSPNLPPHRIAECRNNTSIEWWDSPLQLTTAQIHELITAAPGIVDLEIDIPRYQNPSSLNATFHEISRLQHLRKLTLHFESPSMITTRSVSARRRDSYIESHPDRGTFDPLVNASWTMDVFQNIRREQRRNVAEAEGYECAENVLLSSLDVYVGGYETRNIVGMLGPLPVVVGHYQCGVKVNAKKDDENKKLICEGGVEIAGQGRRHRDRAEVNL